MDYLILSNFDKDFLLYERTLTVEQLEKCIPDNSAGYYSGKGSTYSLHHSKWSRLYDEFWFLMPLKEKCMVRIQSQSHLSVSSIIFRRSIGKYFLNFEQKCSNDIYFFLLYSHRY